MTDICRLCASLKTVDHLTPINEPSLALKKKLLRCCQLELFSEDDILPQNVCESCVQRLDSAWSFAESVAQAQSTLQKAFSTNLVQHTAELSGTRRQRQQKKAINKTDRELADVSIKLQSAIRSLHIQRHSVEEIALRLNVNIDFVQSCITMYESLRAKPSTNVSELPPISSNLYAQSVAVKEYVDSPSQQHDTEWDQQMSVIEEAQPTSPHIEFEELEESSSNSFQMVEKLEDDSDHNTAENEAFPPKTTPINDDVRETWKNLLWNCCECGEQFTNSLNIPNHFSEHHGNGKLHFACSDCTRTFTRLNAFVNHVRYVHRSNLKYCCDVCCHFTADQKAFAEHMATHHSKIDNSHLCPTCGKGFQKSSHFHAHVKCHASAAEKVQYSCDVCHKKCSTKANLASHKRIHNGIREFTCDQCGRSFVQKGNLHSHILTHVKAKPFACLICDKSFKTANRLTTHKKVHTDHRPHKCHVCNRDFREKNTLKEHMRIHTGDMPYECEYCSKRFRFKGVLATHRRTHTGERPYSCMACNHHFTNWPNYNKHMVRRHGINTSKTLRKPNTLPPSGMPANAKLNYVVPTVVTAPMPSAETTLNPVDINLDRDENSVEDTILDTQMHAIKMYSLKGPNIAEQSVVIGMPNEFTYIPASINMNFNHSNIP